MKLYNNMLTKVLRDVSGIFVIAILSIGCNKDQDKIGNDFTLVTASGDITSKVNEFRQVLGNQLNTSPGSIGGRRELNWDGIPAALLDKPLEGNFFNTPGNNVPASRQKGLVYSAGINNFQVSNDGFKSVNPSTAAAFASFSGSQTFSNTVSNLWDIGFQVPGESVPATVKGFGMVFSDVDMPNSTFMEFFNGTESLGKFFAPIHDASSNLSFLGIHFRNQKITHVQIGHDGTLSEGGNDISNGGQKDFVVFDDFLFDEPVKQ